ncbi:helix-turn-helix transcriptional regulator [Listeria sp. FSL L7-0083]|uniref:helix-turn-helix domain-containing protein n=1 Tax=Listeria farberi TaxID=2713500 RepID=UPI001628E9D9|nr:helix-turn-helix transcriptional regulator [Listeria farberi]MBC2267721.1 helix-turn-helix transcriptional regulator [Listeria farberi]
MNYYNQELKDLIDKSGLSLKDISEASNEYDTPVTVSYLSKLKNGHMPPPSFKVSYTLATILNGDPSKLLALGVVDRQNEEILELMNLLEERNPEMSSEEIFEEAFRVVRNPLYYTNDNGSFTRYTFSDGKISAEFISNSD